jgi:uncharacterized protein YndB with AHSA1/START domain
MSQPMIVRSSIHIQAPAAKVWKALTDAEITKQYMFGCAALSDWKVGSPLLWKGTFNGIEVVAVKGTVVDIQPNKVLSFTTFDPNSTLEDIPENYVTATYTLTETKGETLLEVSQGDFSTVADGERRYAETYNNGEGWTPILREIKKIVEA